MKKLSPGSSTDQKTHDRPGSVVAAGNGGLSTGSVSYRRRSAERGGAQKAREPQKASGIREKYSAGYAAACPESGTGKSSTF